MGVNYNYDAKFDVIGRVPDGNQIIAYVIQDRQSKEESLVDKDVFEQMCLNRSIYNVYAQIYENKVNLKGIGKKLTDLSNFNARGNVIERTISVKNMHVKLVGRVMSHGRTVDYLVRSFNNSGYTISMLDRDSVIKLARKGLVDGVTVQLSNGSYILRSKGTNTLKDLKIYKE